MNRDTKTWEEYCNQKIIPPDQLEKTVGEIRGKGCTIATLNGSFDLLHAGHLYIIYEASIAADILIVALNSDASIQKYKDPKKPVVPLMQRMLLVAALELVDYVTWFEQTDPRTILAKIKPDVHVNGAEYGESCIEAEIVKQNGGRLCLVPRIPGLATSDIIKKIKNLN